MAHLTLAEIQSSLDDDVAIIAALAKSIKECETADEARPIAEHLEEHIHGGILDMLNMIGDIAAGREEDDLLYGDDESHIPIAPPKFTPDWALLKPADGGPSTPIYLNDADQYIGRCPQCGEPVALGSEEFFGTCESKVLIQAQA